VLYGVELCAAPSIKVSALLYKKRLSKALLKLTIHQDAMPLPPPTVSRERSHVRHVTYTGYARADGRYDIEAHLIDQKDADYPLASGVRKAHTDLHNLAVRFTIDRAMTIHAVVAAHDEQPYPGYCETIAPDYAALVGLNLIDNFRLRLHERMGGVKGCTHINEMLAWLPSAAFQTLAGERKEIQPDSDQKPFQLDRCHALASHGEAAKTYYPKWYRPAATSAPVAVTQL
jgi:hypothetical protein